MRFKILILVFFTIHLGGFASLDSTGFFQVSNSINSQRIISLTSAEVISYTGVMWGLNNLWYKDYPRSNFHFFNDNKEWLQMDKLGHAATAYYVGYAGMKAMNWTGLNGNKSLLYGGTLGLLFLTSIEVFDGFSDEWGASPGDLIANTFGFALLAAQELAWKEQKILLKFSAHFSEFAQYRPNLLGKSWSERLLKDYNGQTYWLSANLASLTKLSKVPNWLNLAIGYGATGMIGGHENPSQNTDGFVLPEFSRYRQYYLSVDVDLTRIKTKNALLNTVLGSVGFIKLPFPAVEISNHGVKGHWLYF